jgi:iron complex transport system ATP-binding protein
LTSTQAVPESTQRMCFATSNVQVSYGSRRVLHGVDVQPIPAGSVVGLIGANGAGKSTLIRAVAGLQKYSGKIQLPSVQTATTEKNSTGSQKPGYVPQDLPTGTSLTVLETLLLSVRANGTWRVRNSDLQRAGTVLERLGISRLAHRVLSELSGGQRQLAAIGQVFVRRPELMLLDEPTSALDLFHQIEVLELLREEVQARGSTAIVSLHDVNLAARHCDQVLVLHGGRLAAQEHPVSVFTEQLFAEVYGVSVRILDDGGCPVVTPLGRLPRSRNTNFTVQ